MLRQAKQKMVSAVNRNTSLKRGLLQLYDGYHKYAPFVVGYLTRNPAYIKNVLNTKVLAKPGTLGFKGGAFNPGAFYLQNDKVLLLAKSQVLPWFEAHGKNRQLYMLGSPVVMVLNMETLKKEDEFVISNLIGFRSQEKYAIEDFRLFSLYDRIFVNHSLILKKEPENKVSSVLSELDLQTRSLKLLSVPAVDFSTNNVEKNWVYKEVGGSLYLFYSVNPFRVLKLKDDDQLSFHTIINSALQNRLEDPGGFGTMVSFSTNPIDFDVEHLLVIIHQIRHQLTGRCYFHWAVLIDKKTLLPVRITSRPIFSGMGARGRVPGYRYISSILKKGDDILFFAGEGDVYVTLTTKKIAELNSLFTAL